MELVDKTSTQLVCMTLKNPIKIEQHEHGSNELASTRNSSPDNAVEDFEHLYSA
jgi:hypothetical protein